MSINSQIAPKDEIFIWADQASDSELNDDHSSSEEIMVSKTISQFGRTSLRNTPRKVNKKKPCKYGIRCSRKKTCVFYHSTDAKEEDTINIKSVKMCKWGAECQRKDCWFSHPSAKKCKWGAECQRKDCWFSHPSSKPEEKSKVRSFYPVRSIKKTIDHKICKYRTDCKKRDCKWFHPSSEGCTYETIQECIRENKKACNMRHLDETPRNIK